VGRCRLCFRPKLKSAFSWRPRDNQAVARLPTGEGKKVAESMLSFAICASTKTSAAARGEARGRLCGIEADQVPAPVIAEGGEDVTARHRGSWGPPGLNGIKYQLLTTCFLPGKFPRPASPNFFTADA